MRALIALFLFVTAPTYSWQAPKSILNSVVLLSSPEGSGTGFHVRAPSGNVYILTNKHVCGKAEAMQAVMESGAHPMVRVLSKSLFQDLCILETSGGDALQLGDEPLYKDTVAIYGHPLAGPLSMSIGGITSRTDDDFDSTAPVKPGNSGSPVLNDSGLVVGIVFAYHLGRGDSIFISVARVKEFLATF